MLRVLLLDDDTVARESLAQALSKCPEFSVVPCANQRDAIALLTERPDVILVEHDAGEDRSDELFAAAARFGLAQRILVCTKWMSELERRRLLRLGIGGVFTRQRGLEYLQRAIQCVHSGAPWLEDSEPAPREAGGIRKALSEQERRAANLVLEGLSNRDIAAHMGVSASYVKGVLQRVFLKMGVRSRGQLFLIAMEDARRQAPSQENAQRYAQAGAAGSGDLSFPS